MERKNDIDVDKGRRKRGGCKKVNPKKVKNQ
jgi:hypothetical protein